MNSPVPHPFHSLSLLDAFGDQEEIFAAPFSILEEPSPSAPSLPPQSPSCTKAASSHSKPWAVLPMNLCQIRLPRLRSSIWLPLPK